MARTFGGVSTDRIDTGYTANNTLRSYHIWSYRTGEGGGSVGRMFDKGGNTLLDNNGSGTIAFGSVWTGNLGLWHCSMSDNAWNPIGVSYDAGSSSNVPIMYVGGASQSLTTDSSPSGSAPSDSNDFCIGNRNTDNARNWAGRLAEFAVWDAILNASEFAALALGVPAYRVRPQSLSLYVPVWGLASPEPDLSSGHRSCTVTGTTQVSHPPVTLFTPKGHAPVVDIAGGGGFVSKFRKTLSGVGTRVGSRQLHGW